MANKKIIILALLMILLIILIIFCFWTSVFNSKILCENYSREELVDNFNKREKDFQKLVDNFQSVISLSSIYEKYQITLELGQDTTFVTLVLYPFVIDSVSKIIGSKDLKKNSLEYNNLLKTLNWNNEIINSLEKQLKVIGCSTIRTVNYYGGCKYEIYPCSKGVSSYSYQIYDKQISDSLMLIKGRSISSSSFGKQVILYKTSIL